jgi:hypothetical protein
MVSLKAGLRASGNGSAATMVPTRMSTFMKSSKEMVPLAVSSPAMLASRIEGATKASHGSRVKGGSSSIALGPLVTMVLPDRV